MPQPTTNTRNQSHGPAFRMCYKKVPTPRATPPGCSATLPDARPLLLARRRKFLFFYKSAGLRSPHFFPLFFYFLASPPGAARTPPSWPGTRVARRVGSRTSTWSGCSAPGRPTAGSGSASRAARWRCQPARAARGGAAPAPASDFFQYPGIIKESRIR